MSGKSAKIATQEGSFVAAGFDDVRDVFDRHFADGREIGAAVAAYWRGEKVVDLWGGRRTPDGHEPWNEDTMVVVNSTTKGLAAMTIAVANSRGWIDYDARVAEYWPDFAQNGKGEVTVRQLLSHEAGLVCLEPPLRAEELPDLDRVARVLASQKPAWKPGARHGYHAMTIGLYMQELIRHVDPAHRTLGRFFQEEIANPLDVDFYIGLPPEIPDERLGKLTPFAPGRAFRALGSTPAAFIVRLVWPRSLLRRSLLFAGLDFNDRRWLEVELPAGNGVGTARGIARAYSAFAEGGGELGITQGTLESLMATHDVDNTKDVVMGLPTWLSLGFLKPGPNLEFGSSERAFGTPGAGGSFGFADPDARLGFAYVMNKTDYYLLDPREKELRDAVYRCIRRVAAGDENRPRQ